MTLEEYLEREAISTIKHEFHHGKLTEMAGGTPAHAQIGGNFLTFLNINLSKIEIYYCKNGKRNVWIYSFETGLDASIKLQSLGCTLKLKDIYTRITF